MRKLAVVFMLALGACQSTTGGSTARPDGGAATTGASGPRAAVDGFLGAVKSQDLQAMSSYWGSAKGPARDALERDVLEKRELIMQCYLSHDRYNVVNEMAGEKGMRVLRVALTKGAATRETNFTTIQGPGRRWYVQEVDLAATADFCNNNNKK